jgi:hypothetical protein
MMVTAYGDEENRLLLLEAPPAAPLRTGQYLGTCHRTVSCTGANTGICTTRNHTRSNRSAGHRGRDRTGRCVAGLAGNQRASAPDGDDPAVADAARPGPRSSVLAARGSSIGASGAWIARRLCWEGHTWSVRLGTAHLRISLLAGAPARRRAGSTGDRSRPCSPNIPTCAKSRPGEAMAGHQRNAVRDEAFGAMVSASRAHCRTGNWCCAG